MYQKVLKPVIDFIVALVILLLLSPLFIIVLIGLTIANKGKPFFFQKRPGKDEHLFNIIKFKTMNDSKDEYGNLLSDSHRLTSLGSFVRKTSLDEIPQLINILKGDMSLIGPRPLLPRYLPYYSKREKLRHSVRPGITGWAQVNGRNTLDWDSRLALDVYYVENLSLSLDYNIFIKTLSKVIKRDNVITDPTSILKDLDEERKIEN